jgi:hypothetical protein
MDINDLVDALLHQDLLAARQWVKDARRAGLCFAALPAPAASDPVRAAAAAGLAELLAARNGERAPAWTQSIGAAPEDLWLDAGLRDIPSLRERAVAFAPEPLRRRRIFALPDFLATP